MFGKHTPKNRGRVRVTVEFDALYIRELLAVYRDVLKGLPAMADDIKALIRKVTEE